MSNNISSKYLNNPLLSKAIMACEEERSGWKSPEQ